MRHERHRPHPQSSPGTLLNGLGYLLLCALIVIVVLAWDSRHHQARWDQEDDE